jgi:hypothetical protein
MPHNLKHTTIIAVLGCLMISSVAAIDATRASGSQSVSLSVAVNRINKGDRLPSIAKPAAALSAPSATKVSAPPKGPPLGCDPLFSPIAEPAKARVYRRCAV